MKSKRPASQRSAFAFAGEAAKRVTNTIGSSVRSVGCRALLTALIAHYAIAQPSPIVATVSSACGLLNRRVMAQAVRGPLAEPESLLSLILAGESGRDGYSCAGVIFNNLASAALNLGRIAESERLAWRSVRMLEMAFPPDHVVLLRPLQVIATSRFERENYAGAREVVKRLEAIRVEQPSDRALVHVMAAVMLQVDRKQSAAEDEFLAALRAWQEAGRGETADTISVLTALGSLYIEERQFQSARRTFDQALEIMNKAPDVAPMDRIKLFAARGIMHAHNKEWPDAERELREAILILDRERGIDPVSLLPIFTTYARALSKNHHRTVARAIAARANVLRRENPADMIVSATELQSHSKRAER